jgi:hypothetical protein
MMLVETSVGSQKVGAMAGSNPAESGRIFISYRREETAYPAGWLYDRLAEHFGGGQVFKDVDSIELGDDFVEVITRAVGACDVLLALIGPEWLTITDAQGQRRLDNPADFVRLEIEAALTRNVRVIPILVDGASMPHSADLPETLARLVRRQALELSPSRFAFDSGRLLKVLDRTLAEVRTEHDDAASLREPAEKAPDPSTPEAQEGPERREQAEPSPTPSLPPATPAAPLTARPTTEQSKPPDPSTTEVRETPEQPEQVLRRPTPNTPSAAPAPPAAMRPPSDSGKPPGKQRRGLSTRARVLAGAGVGVVLILLIVAIVANSGTTPPPTGAAITTPPPTGKIVFQENFSSRAYGWEDEGKRPIGGYGGYYKNGAYRFHLEPISGGTSEGSAPRKNTSLFPSAPPNLRVDVKARRLAGDSDTGYGIACRAAGRADSYQFLIGDGYISIAKSLDHDPYYTTLKEAAPAVDINASNRLQAVCSSDEGQQAVHLVFWVNGEKVAEATDTKDPLLTGTVGVFVATGPDAKTAVEAEFDDFAVRQI